MAPRRTRMLRRTRLAPLLLLPAGVAAAKGKPDVAPAANAEDIPQLARLLEQTGWTPAPELSSIFKPGRIFTHEGGPHRLMAEGCFDAPVTTSTYTSLELVRELQAGVAVRTGLGRLKASGSLVKRLKFGTPEQQSLPLLAMAPNADCAAQLAGLPAETRAHLYAVQEVLNAEIAEQTCGRLDARGRFVGLGEAEAELAAACAQVSLEPVAVGYRIVAIDDLDLTLHAPAQALAPVETPDAELAVALDPKAAPAGSGCRWDPIQTVASAKHTLTINGDDLDVASEEDQLAVKTALQQCGRYEASRAFERWRRNQRATTIAAATLVGVYPFGVGIVTKAQTEKWRLRTEALILDPAAADGDEKWQQAVRDPP